MKKLRHSVKGDVVAHVTLYETWRGGRRGPTPRDEFGCKTVIDDEVLDIKLYFDAVGLLRPGQSADVVIRFLYADHARKHVAVGKTFKLREINVIGEGIIDRVTMSP
jgi:hypothetical protein